MGSGDLRASSAQSGTTAWGIKMNEAAAVTGRSLSVSSRYFLL